MHNETTWQSSGMRLGASLTRLLFGVVLGVALVGLAGPGHAEPLKCNGELKPNTLRFTGQGGVKTSESQQPDLLVDKLCLVTGTPHYYAKVNIIDGGKLVFVEPSGDTTKTQDFWASAIIIENGGEMLAGVDHPELDPDTKKEVIVPTKPYGSNAKTLRIHLYGANPGSGKLGALCAGPTDTRPWDKFTDCGIPRDIWKTNGSKEVDLPGDVKDRFYKYSSLHGDADSPTQENIGHFGNKVLAVSYGGTLRLRGLKGTTGTSGTPDGGKNGEPTGDIATLLKDPDKLTKAEADVITNPGTDWLRLSGLNKAAKQLTLTRSVSGDWAKDDQVVVTTTDYFPDHSEVQTIATKPTGNVITVNGPIVNDHNFTAYNVEAKVGSSTSPTAFRAAVEKVDGANPAFLKTAETRAAVALLTRSIRILSAGDDIPKQPDPNGRDFDKMPKTYAFGAQAVFRQGFKKVQIQGVEFAQMGQGGILGRYPVHFHLARRVPKDTYVIDSSINESMTRWIVIHSTLGVTLARNVGWKSIGHGYFLEDATEVDNKLYANIGIFARAAIAGDANPRQIPGLLAAPNAPMTLPLKYHSDTHYPSVFWLTNGWNTVAGNMAAGAGTCGACYWYVAAGNHDMMDVQPDGQMGKNPKAMTWAGYALIQQRTLNNQGLVSRDGAGQSPVKLFYKNYCSSAMHSLTTSDESPCVQTETGMVTTLNNPTAPPAPGDEQSESAASKMYYPRYTSKRNPTICNPAAADDQPDSCAVVTCQYGDPKYCASSTFSYYTSSFNWAQTNFSAIWLRGGGYFLLDHTFLSDVQGPGVTIVTGGDYTRANLPVGYWGLTSNSIFVGATQPTNKYAVAKGPLDCTNRGNVCLDAKTGIGFPLAAWGTGQRMYNIYDGPAYQDANAFIDIKASPCTKQADCIYYGILGVRKARTAFGDVATGQGYLPNAAIGWKQSNGFYYPPAFHSANLFFNNVDIRHYVVEPITYPGTYRTNAEQVGKEYVGVEGNKSVFDNYTDVDRQTELNDDDGTLTGFSNTISVNEDPFFAAPIQTAQCKSNGSVDPDYACAGKTNPNTPTARTSPYDHITTVIYPDCAIRGNNSCLSDQSARWDQDCTSERCYGVPIYRQYLTGQKDNPPSREWKTWIDNKCDDLAAIAYDKNPAPPGTIAMLEKGCRYPFVRMAGTAGWQRSVLTVNNGKYFIDTTRSSSKQLTSSDLVQLSSNRTINVFAAGKTYYVFFVFAKEKTHQTYQIYVGPGFDTNTVKAVQFQDFSGFPLPAPKVLAKSPWTVSMNKDRKDVLQVDVNFEKVPTTVADLRPTNLNSDVNYMDATCQPHSYCTKVTSGSKTTCGCDEKKLGPLALLNPNYKNMCKNVCGLWAVSDMDCPKEGCLGFQFTLPGGFKAQDQYERPKPEVYPGDTWDKLVFVPTTKAPDNDKSQKKGTGCYYSAANTPGVGACKVAD